MPTIRELLAKLDTARRDAGRCESKLPTTGDKSKGRSGFQPKAAPKVTHNAVRRGGKRGG